MTDRTTESQVDRLFLDCWSPRALNGSSLGEADLRTLLDAARWAPSSFNAQPWRLLYAVRGDANWDRFLSLLVPANQVWAKNASLLIFFVSATTSHDRPSHTHSFDAGSAWMSLALQAQLMGLHAHGMAGVDYDAARIELGVPTISGSKPPPRWGARPILRSCPKRCATRRSLAAASRSMRWLFRETSWHSLPMTGPAQP